MLLWKILDQREYGHEYVEATSMPLSLMISTRQEVECELIQKCLENPVEFWGREVVNDDFPTTFSFLDHHFSTQSFLQSFFNIRPGCSP